MEEEIILYDKNSIWEENIESSLEITLQDFINYVVLSICTSIIFEIT